MKTDKSALCGSPSRDAFKLWHKTLPRNLWALDIDFIFVEKNPPRIVAILDYKRWADQVTFTECLAFNDLMIHYPVFIIRGEQPFDRLSIYRYLGGDWHPDPPRVKMEPQLENITREEYVQWEVRLRNDGCGV